MIKSTFHRTKKEILAVLKPYWLVENFNTRKRKIDFEDKDLYINGSPFIYDVIHIIVLDRGITIHYIDFHKTIRKKDYKYRELFDFDVKMWEVKL